MRLSVIVVSYNTKDLLRRCLSSLGDCHEVIVVDNASADGSAEMVSTEFPTAKLIANERNQGFGRANNQGFEAMTGDVALLLNSDAFATSGAIEALIEAMQDPSVVACGGMLVNPISAQADWDAIFCLTDRGDPSEPRVSRLVERIVESSIGRVAQNSCANELTLWAVFCEQTGLEKLLPTSRLCSPYWETRRILRRLAQTRLSKETTRKATLRTFPVAQVMGACLMMRPVERFDERFFLYCEDTELCHRLRRHGQILYVPTAVFGHELGASSRARWEAVAWYNHGKELYFRIHQGRTAMAVCWLMDRCGALARFAVSALAMLVTLGLASSVRRKASVFWRVLTSPAKGPRLSL